METPSRHPLADLVQSLAGLHQETHQDLRAVREEQQKRFEALLQAQHEDRELFRSWMDREVQASPKPTSDSAATIALSKMGPMDDPEAFIDLFERSAAARDWPKEDWPMRLLPLLSGEAQVAAHQLPVKNLLVYDDLKRAILQRVGRTPEQHRQRFRTLALEESGRPFIFAHQLRDSCRKWLMAGECDAEGIIDRVVLEQFVARLPRKTAQWVQCHRPASLDQAIQLAEDQMVACHGVGEPLPAASLSLSSLSLSPPNPAPSLSKPVPAPRSRAGVPPRPAPRWRTGPAAETAATPRPAARGGGSLDPFPGSLSPSLSPRQGLDPLPATRAAGRPGPACWRCGDPGHFIDRCPMMDVGTLVRVPDAPQAAPDQAGLYQIPTDASDRGLGAVLSQEVEGEERPVLYISRKLSKREAVYSTIEKECLAIRWAVLTLRYYLLGREFTLCSDHAPLQWLHRMKDTNARITRWYLALQPFKFKVVHRPGAQMAVADFLSRRGGGEEAAGRMAPRPESGGGVVGVERRLISHSRERRGRESLDWDSERSLSGE
ncbi:uncharacterized protein [Pseudorasbora parva]|uniref:uncharacterized protein n=1 Tax=Pseudorasbora parva TaxID=51549 RepID=UPI00351F4FB8